MTVDSVPSDLLARVGPGRIAAAEDYLVGERVEAPVRYGEHLAATVRGFTGSYRTRVTLGSEPRGSCPCGRRSPLGLCPHALAVALLYRRDPGRFADLAAAFQRHERSPRSEREAAWAQAVLAGVLPAPEPADPEAPPGARLERARERLSRLTGWAAVSALAEVAAQPAPPGEEAPWIEAVADAARRIGAAPPPHEPGALRRIAPLMTLALGDDRGLAQPLYALVARLCRGGGETWFEDALRGALLEQAARVRADPGPLRDRLRLGRLLAWLVRWLEGEGRWAEALELARRWPMAPGALELEVGALVVLGQTESARRRVESARVSPAERRAARRALGEPPPLPWGAFFRDPSPRTLAALLDAAPPSQRGAVERHALELLERSGAADALTQIALAGGGARDLFLWARRARPALRAQVGLALLERDPVHALTLLEEARRDGQGDPAFPRARVRRALGRLYRRLGRPGPEEPRG